MNLKWRKATNSNSVGSFEIRMESNELNRISASRKLLKWLDKATCGYDHTRRLYRSRNSSSLATIRGQCHVHPISLDGVKEQRSAVEPIIDSIGETLNQSIGVMNQDCNSSQKATPHRRFDQWIGAAIASNRDKSFRKPQFIGSQRSLDGSPSSSLDWS